MFGRKKDATKDGAQDQGGMGRERPEGFDPGARATPSTPTRPELPRRVVDIPSAPAKRTEQRAPAGVTESKRLIVGRDIRLKGEITSCDRLIVEGSVEISVTDARQIEVAQTGHFKGAAEVVEADISGFFEGDLTARERLTVRATGKVKGRIRYGRIIIEAGGQISGETEALGADSLAPGASAEPLPETTPESDPVSTESA